MPLFEFECEKCGKKEEHIVFQSDKEPIICECGNMMMKAFPNTMEFRLLYNPAKDKVSWAAEGYATTQRYKEYDKQAKHNIFVQPGEENGNKT